MTPRVRAAEERDMDVLLLFGAKLHQRLRPEVPYEPSYLRSTLDASIRGGMCLVSEHDGRVVGAIAGAIVPYLGNPMIGDGVEVFFWVEPGSGVGASLVARLERLMRNEGAHYFTVAAREHCSPDRARKLYELRGHRNLETSFTKELV